MKTRMHEILGVEEGEVFGFKEASWEEEVKYYNLDACGNVFRAVEDHKRVPSPKEIVAIINRPDRIIRKPRLTAEQLYALEALYRVFGAKWIAKDQSGHSWGFSNKPPRWTTSWGDPAVVRIDHVDVLTPLVSWADTEPLSILQTLRDNGVDA